MTSTPTTLTDATTSGLFTVTSSDADRNVSVVGTNNETKKRLRTTSETSSSSEEATDHSETSSIENNKRICYEGCDTTDIITGLLSLDNSNNGTINSNNETNSNTSLYPPPRQFDLPIPNPLALPVPPVVVEGQQQHSLMFPPAAGFVSNNDHDHAEATAGVEEAIAEVEEVLLGTIQVAPAAPTATVTTTAKKALFMMCQRPLCAKPYIRAATVAAANDVVSSSLLCQTTAKSAKGDLTIATMMSRAIAPTAATPTAATPAAAVPVQSRINMKSSSLPNTIPTTTTTQTTAPLAVSAPPPLPLPTSTTTNRSVLPPAPAPANPTPAVSVSTSFVPYRTYAYQQQVQASSGVLPTTATAQMNNIATATYRNPTTQQRITLWKQQQLIQQQQQQVQRLAQQQQVQQRAQQQQQRPQQQHTPPGRRFPTQQQQRQQQRQCQRQQQGIYHSDDDESQRRTGTGTRRRCPLSQPPQLPTTILK